MRSLLTRPLPPLPQLRPRDFKDHPDSDFPGVIRSCQVRPNLFTCAPFACADLGALLQLLQHLIRTRRWCCWGKGGAANCTRSVHVMPRLVPPFAGCPVHHHALAHPAVPGARVVPVRGAAGGHRAGGCWHSAACEHPGQSHSGQAQQLLSSPLPATVATQAPSRHKWPV